MIKTRGQDEQAALAEECLARGLALAAEALDREYGAVLASTLEDGGASFDEDAVLYVEKQYLGGLFHELVQEYPTPVNSYDRIKVLIIYYLTKVRGRSFEQARDEANSVEDLFNRDDHLFGIISDFGKAAYRGDHSNGVATVLQALARARADGQ